MYTLNNKKPKHRYIKAAGIIGLLLLSIYIPEHIPQKADDGRLYVRPATYSVIWNWAIPYRP